MMWRICLFAAAAAILAFCAGWWLRGRSAIDSCLDAGGRWQAQDGYCLGAAYGRRRFQALVMIRPLALAIAATALLSPALPVRAQSAQPAARVGEGHEIRILRESTQSSSDGSSGSSHDADGLVERVIAVRENGVELEFDLPPEATAEDRARSWQFPVRVLRPSTGPLELLNGAELEARIERWLTAGGMTRQACGHWIFTWNAFKIECDPQSVIRFLTALDLGTGDLRDGASHQAPGAREPGRLRRERQDSDGATFVVEMAVDPEAMRRERAEADAATLEIMGDNPALRAALAGRAAERISGTIRIRFETDAEGRLTRRTKVTRVEIRGPGNEQETRAVTETIERRPVSAPGPGS